MSNYYSCRDIGLSAAEIAALKQHADDRLPEVKALVSGYNLHAERIQGALNGLAKEGKVDANRIPEILAIYSITERRVEAFSPLPVRVETDEEHGYFTHHPSFGCVGHSVVSSTHPSHVGTPTMSGYETTLRFYHASFGTAFSFDSEPRLSEERGIVETALSSEQFASLMRNHSAGSPCALGRSAHLLMDIPPRMVSTDTIAEEVKHKALAIGQPLVDACSELQDFLKDAPKISTKAEYEQLKQKVDRVREVLVSIVEPMKALLSETAGLVAESATRQMLAELAEPLKALGMDTTSIMRLLEH